jgi:hypothetical protein
MKSVPHNDILMNLKYGHKMYLGTLVMFYAKLLNYWLINSKDFRKDTTSPKLLKTVHPGAVHSLLSDGRKL